ncbi:TPA: CHAP domain-containing protein [Staphylococcus aureus]|uniref:CHAP domain-containing protein n=1 Tax=Staphylococcus argenteus TaxID=985002 RepID=UPI001F4912C0|nr:CHAP domain-containing protein [Staphylococcus argenteus]
MAIKKIITCTILSSMALTGIYILDENPKINSTHIANAAEIDKYPKPIKQQQANYHWKNNCTWYVHNKRNEIKRYLPSSFTHAKNWLVEAKRAGFATGKKPLVGSILQTSKGGYGYGHVAFVEKVNADGSIKISEYNYKVRLGYSTRTLTKKEAAQYDYIY